MKNYLTQLNGREQTALHCIKKLIAQQWQAQLIYCFGCTTNISIKRTAFSKKQLKEERRFTCELLIIVPDNKVIDEAGIKDMQEMVAHFGTVHMVIHPLYFVIKQINEGNLFFNWVHKNGMLLYDLNNTTQLLPEPVAGEYRTQAEAFYNMDAGMNNYLNVKFTPIVKPEKPNTPKPVEIKLMLDAANGWQPMPDKNI